MPQNSNVKHVVTTRVPVCTLATLAKYYAELRSVPKSRSALISKVMEDTKELLVEKKLVEEITDISVANALLNETGLVPRVGISNPIIDDLEERKEAP